MNRTISGTGTLIVATAAALFLADSHAQMDEPSLAAPGDWCLLNDSGCQRVLVRTSSRETGHSVICDLGQAVADPTRDNYYKNKPIPGTRLEMRARGTGLVTPESIKSVNYFEPWVATYGDIVITRNGEIIVQWETEQDDISMFRWDGRESSLIADSNVTDERIEIDFIVGNGFYRKGTFSRPSYFLSNCKKIKKEGLPLYKEVPLRPGEELDGSVVDE